MARKERKNITNEIYEIIRIMKAANQTISFIANSLSLSTKTVSRAFKKFESVEEFISAETKSKNTWKEKTHVFTPVDRIIFNSIICNNSLTQVDLKNIVFENLGVVMSRETIGKKLIKMGLTRKRLTLIPTERNSEDKIEARTKYAAELSRFSRENLVF